MKRVVLIAIGLSALIAASGCSVSKRSLKDAEQRISALLEKGVPDSSLSRAKVFLYQAKDAKGRGDRGIARAAADSMSIHIAKAEEKFTADMERLKPYIADMRAKFQRTGQQLSGLHKHRLDSLAAKVDSLTAMNWLIAAEAEANNLDTILPRLLFDQKRADELRSRITGSWVCTNKITHEVDKTVNGVEKKTFTYHPDGSGTLVETKQGKTSPFLKEDWEFRSWGNWDLYGDTVYLFVNRFAAVRQQFEEFHQQDGKTTWEKKNHPTYDSTITDHSQDRWISFGDLKTDFVHQ
jgi:hypothetical protein